MAVLDEKGRLFGIVNVVDLVVVLAVLAVLSGGVFLVVSSDTESGSEPEPEPEPTVETNVTLVFSGAHPWTVEQLDRDGTLKVSGNGAKFRLEDSYVTAQGGQSIEGALQGTIEANSTYRPSQSVQLNGEQASLKTRVATVGSTSLEKERTPLSLTTTVPSAVAENIDSGTDLTVAGQQVGTITDVAVLDTTGGNTTLHVGVEMETVRIGSQRYVGRTPLAIGTELRLSTAEIDITGHLSRVGSTDPPASTSSDAASVESVPNRA